MRRTGCSTLATLATPAALLALALAATGCGPTYPNCNSDEDCNREVKRNEFCVNQKCQQCRSDADCGAGKTCNKGRCDAIPDYCENDGQCQNGACINNRCKPCGSDGECGEGGKCRKGKCLRKGACEVDDDCPEDQDCKAGKCVGGSAKAPQNEACKLQTVYFDFNEANLSGESTGVIDKNAACMKQVGRAVRITGHTDARGTEEYNLALAEKRAQQVRDRLQMLGIDPSKVQTLPKGELEAGGRDEQSWSRDRRVDFEWK